MYMINDRGHTPIRSTRGRVRLPDRPLPRLGRGGTKRATPAANPKPSAPPPQPFMVVKPSTKPSAPRSSLPQTPQPPQDQQPPGAVTSGVTSGGVGALGPTHKATQSSAAPSARLSPSILPSPSPRPVAARPPVIGPAKSGARPIRQTKPPAANADGVMRRRSAQTRAGLRPAGPAGRRPNHHRRHQHQYGRRSRQAVWRLQRRLARAAKQLSLIQQLSTPAPRRRKGWSLRRWFSGR